MLTEQFRVELFFSIYRYMMHLIPFPIQLWISSTSEATSIENVNPRKCLTVIINIIALSSFGSRRP